MKNPVEDYAKVVEECKVYLAKGWKAMEKPCHQGEYAHIAVYMLANHVVECLDGIVILVEKGSALPCQFLLRGILDAYLGIKFILSANQADGDRRGLAYFYFQAKQEEKQWSVFDPDSERGKSIRNELTATGENASTLDVDSATLRGVRQIVDQITLNLGETFFDPIRTELATTFKGKKPKNWYALFGGADNVRELAKKVSYLSGYEKLYRPWSSQSHGTGTFANTFSADNATLALRPIRHGDGIERACEAAGDFGIVLGIQLFHKFAPSTPDYISRYEELRGKIAALVRNHVRQRWDT